MAKEVPVSLRAALAALRVLERRDGAASAAVAAAIPPPREPLEMGDSGSMLRHRTDGGRGGGRPDATRRRTFYDGEHSPAGGLHEQRARLRAARHSFAVRSATDAPQRQRRTP